MVYDPIDRQLSSFHLVWPEGDTEMDWKWLYTCPDTWFICSLIGRLVVGVAMFLGFMGWYVWLLVDYAVKKRELSGELENHDALVVVAQIVMRVRNQWHVYGSVSPDAIRRTVTECATLMYLKDYNGSHDAACQELERRARKYLPPLLSGWWR
jgi:hypothetical protein